MPLADSSDLSVRQLVHAVAHPSRVALWMQTTCVAIAECGAAFSTRVSNIVARRSKKEMVGPDAGSVVTGMTNVESGWNVAVRQPVGDSVRGFPDALKLECPVSASGKTSFPQPAPVGLLGVCPEMRDGLTRDRGPVTRLRTVAFGGRPARRTATLTFLRDVFHPAFARTVVPTAGAAWCSAVKAGTCFLSAIFGMAGHWASLAYGIDGHKW
jgi:hypothetical protein